MKWSFSQPLIGGWIRQKKFNRKKTHWSISPTPTKYIAEHTVTADDTLSHIALKYYGSAVKEKWMTIYEANKAVIGDNPNRIRSGQVLKIPELLKE